MSAPARMTAAPRHPFEVRHTPPHPHPMIVGTIARVARGLTGGASVVSGQPVVITDARRIRPDGPLWLTLSGLAVAGPLVGRNVAVSMTTDVAHAGGLTDYLPGEWRARECTVIDHGDHRWHVTLAPLVGPGFTWCITDTANDSAELAYDLYATRLANRRAS